MLFSNFAAFNLRHCLELPEIVSQDGKTETELLKSVSLLYLATFSFSQFYSAISQFSAVFSCFLVFVVSQLSVVSQFNSVATQICLLSCFSVLIRFYSALS